MIIDFNYKYLHLDIYSLEKQYRYLCMHIHHWIDISIGYLYKIRSYCRYLDIDIYSIVNANRYLDIDIYS